MPRINLLIANGFYQSDSLVVSNQLCTNFYPNIIQTDALSQETLFGTAGLKQIQTTGDKIKDINRGSHTKNGIFYFLNGTVLYRLNRVIDAFGVETFSTVSLGTILGDGLVSMSDNGTQLMIVVPNTDGYILDANDVLQKITDIDFKANGNPVHVVFIDSFFAVSTDAKKFIISASNDGLNWNALDFSSAESNPDEIVSLHVHKNKLYIAGGETIEEFQNVGAGDFPFRRTGLFLNKGVFAQFSMIEAESTFMFIGGGVNESPAIWALNGNGVEKVSNTSIDSFLQSFTDSEIKNSFAWSYAQKGAYFVGFSLPKKTFIFDMISKRWHERSSQIINTKGFTETIRWRINSLSSAYNKIICGDSRDGRIGVVDVNEYSEYNREIKREFSISPVSDSGNPITISQLELTVESGVGNGDSENPEVRLSISKDGKTFLDDLPRKTGKIGEFNRRTIWRKLGRFSRMAIFRFTMSDKVKPVIIKLEANIRGGQIGN